jgi:DNA ligase-associated metallophosphoesterase
MSYLSIQLAGEEFYLLPQRAVFRPALRQLILSDLHLGKTSHFRKQGIPLPVNSYLKDFEKLNYLLITWQPLSVLFLGDLFHSAYNREWLRFKSLLMEFPQVQFVLVEGNHDILHTKDYDIPNLYKTSIITEDNFLFSHHPLNQEEKINFCGHIHPGIQLRGTARQSLTFPCFCFSGTQFILPAFGELTGLNILHMKKGVQYFVIGNGSVLKV